MSNILCPITGNISYEAYTALSTALERYEPEFTHLAYNMQEDFYIDGLVESNGEFFLLSFADENDETKTIRYEITDKSIDDMVAHFVSVLKERNSVIGFGWVLHHIHNK